MGALDDLPDVNSLFGLDLYTGSLIVAVLGIVHPMAYGCSFFMPMSYLLLTVWLLVALYFAASVGLIVGIVNSNVLMYSIWIWYSVIFVALMLMMMILLALVFTSKKQRTRGVVVILGMLWYIFPWTFAFVHQGHQHQDGDNQMGLFFWMTIFSPAYVYIRVTIYFVLVVNSYRKKLSSATK